jgi:hypothetical protein
MTSLQTPEEKSTTNRAARRLQTWQETSVVLAERAREVRREV